MSPSPPDVTAHQGDSEAPTGCRLRTKAAKATAPAKIMRSIFATSNFGVWCMQSRAQACLSHVMRVTELAIGIAIRQSVTTLAERICCGGRRRRCKACKPHSLVACQCGQWQEPNLWPTVDGHDRAGLRAHIIPYAIWDVAWFCFLVCAGCDSQAARCPGG